MIILLVIFVIFDMVGGIEKMDLPTSEGGDRCFGFSTGSRIELVDRQTCSSVVDITSLFEAKNIQSLHMSLIYEVNHNYFDESLLYLRHGVVHRLDNKPSTIFYDGDMSWNEYDQLHRTTGPALVTKLGTYKWYQYGQKHRLDAPAVIYHNGDSEWYQHDEYHRVDGPAIEYKNGYKEWWINGFQI